MPVRQMATYLTRKTRQSTAPSELHFSRTHCRSPEFTHSHLNLVQSGIGWVGCLSVAGSMSTNWDLVLHHPTIRGFQQMSDDSRRRKSKHS
jgi:hypothetical protein